MFDIPDAGVLRIKSLSQHRWSHSYIYQFSFLDCAREVPIGLLAELELLQLIILECRRQSRTIVLNILLKLTDEVHGASASRLFLDAVV